jgi:hypothetical protein
MAFCCLLCRSIFITNRWLSHHVYFVSDVYLTLSFTVFLLFPLRRTLWWLTSIEGIKNIFGHFGKVSWLELTKEEAWALLLAQNVMLFSYIMFMGKARKEVLR